MKQRIPYIVLTILLACSVIFFYSRSLDLLSIHTEPLENYLDQVKKTQEVDPISFWKFREFYSRGDFTFNSLGLSNTNALLLKLKLPNTIVTDPNALFTLLFVSEKADSLELLTDKQTISSIIDMDNFPKGKVHVNSESVLYVETPDEYYLIYLHPIKTMLKANGFYKHPGEDDTILSKYNSALTITRFKK